MMSSATSTSTPGRASKDASDAVPAWQLFALAGLVGATFVVFMSRGQSAPAILLLSLTIFAAAAVGVGALRALTPLTGEAHDLGFGATALGSRERATLEREKALTLRSIKELEFDKAMGKVSDGDFAELSARLRAKAVGLIQRLDEHTSYRDQIEREVARRLGPTKAAAPQAVAGACTACGTRNDGDARFCKQCGAAVARA